MPSPVGLRADLLRDQLVELFLNEGFARFTLDDLARQMRCSKSTLYGVGQSKEQLIVNVVEHFFRGAATRVVQRAETVSDPAEKITVYLQAVADELRPAASVFMTDLASHPAARAIYRKRTRLAVERISEIVEIGVQTGTFRPVSAAFVADIVASTMNRIQSGELVGQVGLSDAEAYDELARLVLRGIRF